MKVKTGRQSETTVRSKVKDRDNSPVQHVLVTKYHDLHRHDDHLTTHRHSRFSFYFLMSMTLLRPFVLSDLK